MHAHPDSPIRQVQLQGLLGISHGVLVATEATGAGYYFPDISLVIFLYWGWALGASLVGRQARTQLWHICKRYVIVHQIVNFSPIRLSLKSHSFAQLL